MRSIAFSLLIFAVLTGSLPDVDAGFRPWWGSNRPSGAGRSYYDDHYNDVKTRRDRPPSRNAVLRLPSHKCDCKDGAAQCKGAPEPGWMVEDTVSAVCPVASEVRLLRTQRSCALRRAMGGSLKGIKALKDNSVTGPCVSSAMGEATLKEEVFWGDGDDAWEVGEKKKDDEEEEEEGEYEEEDEEEEEEGEAAAQGGGEEGSGTVGGPGPTGKDQKAAVLLEMQTTALLVASRAASATARSKMWPGPTNEVFYTQSNAEEQRGHVDPLDTTSRGFLPKEQPALRYGSCVVVGNSETLYKAQLGPEIDGHDFVIRINQAPAAGNYGIDVGERTGARFLNRKFTEIYAEHKGRPWLNDDPDGTLLIASRAATKHFRELSAWVATDHADKKVLFANSQLVQDGSALLSSFRQAMQIGLKSAVGGRKPLNPSSGFLAIQLASHLCDTVNITGFALGTPENCQTGTHNCGKIDQKFHYFNAQRLGRLNRPGLTDEPKKHQLGLEGWLLKAYHVLGLVCVFPVPPGLGPCGSRLGGLFTQDGSIAADWPSVRDLLADKSLSSLLKWQPPKEHIEKDLPREYYMKSWVVTPGMGLEEEVDQDHWDKGNKIIKAKAPSTTGDAVLPQDKPHNKPSGPRGLIPTRHRFKGSGPPADQNAAV